MKNEHLGKTATDKITGFKGIVTGAVDYITGCTQYLVTPKGKKGNTDKHESRWYDEPRLEFSKKATITLEIVGDPGPCEQAPIK